MILRPAVPHIRTAFHRLLEPLDRRIIARAVAAHGGDHGVGGGDNAWTCERHLKSLLFAQWAGLSSLREIVAGLRAHRQSFYHLNLRAPCRSTLSDANAERPAAVFRDIATALIPIAAGALRQQGEALIRLLDASPIPLKGDGFPWAEANARTRGLKLHLLYDPRQTRPVWFDVTSAKIDKPALAKAGVVAGRAIPLEPGATYVFDKGYTDYRWWCEILAAGAFFVTRRKRNAYCRPVAEQTATGDRILADRLLQIGHRQPRGGAPLNPLYKVSLREIVVARSDHDQPLYLLTNDLQRPAVDIAQLYKQRWDIELLFKWLKQNLKIRRFLGRSENAVRIQIYVALIAFMLLRVLHHTAARSFANSTALLLTHLKLSLFSPFNLRQHAPSQAAVIAAAKPSSRLRLPMKPNLPQKSRTAVRETGHPEPASGLNKRQLTPRQRRLHPRFRACEEIE
jgi:putative transposase